MSEQLKPCPFCGGKAIVLGGGRHINCGNEHCYMTSVWAKAETRELAAECWNTRADVAPPWINAADQKPAAPGWYLVMLAPGNDWELMSDTPLQVEFDAFTTMPQAFTYSDGWHDGPQDISDAVTHWMPLPAAPKAVA
ncbi:Lar family restriction alleviation protein [Burkholderia vietnamiensis]|uniref:Lar family restriction alleviation protein n=1 Tax=Burkholderia vietnamiensis TaxID=60552 RepID=UPI001CF24E45|nr:Lar family restriction alleviation protein [Burkholderia vietnamiensis]MCA7945610.1 Lar family restriction alleviation protein [Burkholderia vietnamiensis]